MLVVGYTRYNLRYSGLCVCLRAGRNCFCCVIIHLGDGWLEWGSVTAGMRVGVCAEEIACAYVLPRRTKVSGNASVCAVLFLSACASVPPHVFQLLLHIAAHAGWSAFPPPIMYQIPRAGTTRHVGPHSEVDR